MDSTLPLINRYITTHDEQGKAIFTKVSSNSTQIPWEGVGKTKNFGLAYTTSSFPVNLQDEQDITEYENHLSNKPGLTIPGGTVLRYVDYAPGTGSALHRTMSIDYGVVIEGEIELLLDSGESQLMKRGDVSIVRATTHGWRNPSKEAWCRVLFVLVDAEGPIVNGEKLKEDYGSAMPGIKSSS